VQLFNIDKKVKAGSVLVGKKIGLTSLAMQQLLKMRVFRYLGQKTT
jgi:2-keto-4-pentenoate hydratase